MGRAAAGPAIATLIAMLAVAAGSLALATPADAARTPSIVVIVTDDQTRAQLNPRVMPRTMRLLGRRGTVFREAIVTTPQCCPSRASLLTGQYPHNHGVISNNPGYALLDDERNTLPVWLRRAGYRTVHIGKYLNGYGHAHGARPAPGWSRWLTLTATDFHRPRFSIDGERRIAREGAHLTTILTRMARSSIRRYAGRRPLYLQLDHMAPHVGGRPEDQAGPCAGAPLPLPRDRGSFVGEPLPQPPSFDEPDVSDKPSHIQRLPRLDAGLRGELTRIYRCTLASLVGVDRSVATVVRALRQAGALGRTAIIFTSDNGNAFGEHRVPATKGLPYEEHLRVPLLIRPPAWFPRRARRGAHIDAPVANIDLAPTILRLAGARPCGPTGCRRIDGRSLLGLIRGRDPGWAASRTIRIGFSINRPSYRLSCAWEGRWRPDRVIVRHTSVPDEQTNRCMPADEWELYDLERDPHQLRNLLAE